jgi:nitrite reductase (NADH) small subunit
VTAALRIDPPAAALAGATWLDACALEDIPVDCGVAALLAGRQIAIVRVGEGDRLYGISNFDPFSDAFVIARGIVGDRAGRPKIASPIYKQSFDLETGACLDDPKVRLPVYAVRVCDGRVEVQIPMEVPT